MYFQSPVVVAILTNVRSQNSELRIAHFKYILYSIGSCRISDSILTVHMTPSESAKCKVVALFITMGSQFTGSYDVQTTMKVQNAAMKA